MKKTTLLCPKCGCRMSVPLQSVDQHVLCPRCGTSFPGADGLEQIPQTEPVPPSPPFILPTLGWILVVGLFISALVFTAGASRASRRAMALRLERLGEAALAEESSLLLDEFIGIPIALWMIVCLAAYTLANAILAFWVAEDALSRECRGAAIWAMAVFFTSVVGLLCYVIVRPQGSLVVCPGCQMAKLGHAQRCPHCGLAELIV